MLPTSKFVEIHQAYLEGEQSFVESFVNDKALEFIFSQTDKEARRRAVMGLSRIAQMASIAEETFSDLSHEDNETATRYISANLFYLRPDEHFRQHCREMHRRLRAGESLIDPTVWELAELARQVSFLCREKDTFFSNFSLLWLYYMGQCGGEPLPFCDDSMRDFISGLDDKFRSTVRMLFQTEGRAADSAMHLVSLLSIVLMRESYGDKIPRA